jgi:hypothetical protein
MRKPVFIIIALALLVGITLELDKRKNKGRTPEPDLRQSENLSQPNLPVESKSASQSESKNEVATASDSAAPHPSTQATSPSLPGSQPIHEDHHCYAFEFRHKEEIKSRDIEDFLDFTNAFPIVHANVNPKSICLKLNQKAVNFTVIKNKSKQEEVVVGSIVGPESIIRLSYCTGTARCKEDCTPPKKHYMDELMSDANQEDNFSDSWGKEAGDDSKKEIVKKTRELRTMASEHKSLNDRAMMRDWNTKAHSDWACKEK